ncbi:hypothetical protein [Streptomyces sp. NPDC002067]
MTERPPEVEKIVNQTNSGPGTFVGGNVFGHIFNFSGPAQRQHPSAAPDDQDSRGAPDDDYDELFPSLFGAAFLGCVCVTGVAFCVLGLSKSRASPAPALERWAFGFLCGVAFFACAATFLARAAQGLELWAARCADITVETRIPALARLPAGMTRALAALASGMATTAALLAAFYAWGGFGTSIQKRANIARDNAATQAARACAATQR